LKLLHGLASIWGTLLFTLPNRARDTTLKNLRACFPELSATEVDRLAKESLISTASTAMEMGKSWILPIEETYSLVTETEGLEEFKQAAAGNEGTILLAPHLSNWEIFGLFASQNNPTTFMYQPPKLPALDRLLQKTRSRGGIKLAPTDRKGVSLVLKALQRGEMVGVLPDQVPNEEGGEYAEFFGEQALTMTLVSKLIARSQARVFCGFVIRQPKGNGFKLWVREADPEIYDENLSKSVRGLNKTVEDCVRVAVEQYQWEYKRFRKQPDGKKFY
jgi:Kdo2-lipid IVA lauroyltransferase/acyltransferase